LVDDDASLRRIVEHTLSEQGYAVQSASNAAEALRLFKAGPTDLVITDIRMPDMDGIQLLREIKRLDGNAVVVMITAFSSVETAVEAMKGGAFDYVTKPFNREEFKVVVEKGLRHRELLTENRDLRQELATRFSLPNIVGTSERMQKVFKIVSHVAPRDTTVLIRGETGTGKELIARAIHFNSPRAKRPFVAVNCSAIPEGLIESEMFGHVKGAFTGATGDRPGRFEQADGGTLFLDEIGEVQPHLQVKLLRALQERQVDRVGGAKPVDVDVRVIAATSRDLEEDVKTGKFRADLFYRLSVVPILMPALRERREDVPALVEHFMRKLQAPRCRIAPEALRALQEYPWPGNVRELENVIERILVLRERQGELTVADLPDYIVSPRAEKGPTTTPFDIPPEGVSLEAVERGLLLKALEAAGWNQTRAAALLRISRQTLIYRMEKYNLRHAGEK
jgi:two-component system NtrC family response regulator